MSSYMVSGTNEGGAILSRWGNIMRNKTFAGIDYFRLIAAFMVIAIHTSPLSVWNEGH